MNDLLIVDEFAKNKFKTSVNNEQNAQQHYYWLKNGGKICLIVKGKVTMLFLVVI